MKFFLSPALCKSAFSPLFSALLAESRLWACRTLYALWPIWGLSSAWSQNLPSTDADSLRFTGLIKQGSCQLPLLGGNNPNPYVFNLPPVQTVPLLNNGVGKITPLNLKFNTSSDCLIVSGMSAQISFDGGLAAVVPNGGLLRNVAPLRPAQNVYVQLGLLGQGRASSAPLELFKQGHCLFERTAGGFIAGLGVNLVRAPAVRSKRQ